MAPSAAKASVFLSVVSIKKIFCKGKFYSNHFKSIELAFTLLLFFEVVELVLSLEKSVSQSMHIQLEILSLIFFYNKAYSEETKNVRLPRKFPDKSL
ncbi:MAG: hypothetical protein DRJ09_03295 [Bacteroidetes bacterium]|nr:MAG: hypothetical protein DRJ09_03295 [Bacteroidota bacterium]